MGDYDNLLRGEYRPPKEDPVVRPEQMDIAQSNLESANDALRALTNAPFNLGDYVRGLGTGSTVAGEFEKSAEARKRSPLSTAGGELAGTAALTAASPPLGARAAAALAGARVPGVLARGIGYGAEGAAYGGLAGAANTRPGSSFEDYLAGAGGGATLGGAFGLGLGTFFGPRGGMRSSAARPTGAELTADKTRKYDDLEKGAALYEPSTLRAASGPAESAVRDQMYLPTDIPYTLRGLEHMRGHPEVFPFGPNAPVTNAQIEAIRRGTNRAQPGSPDLAAGRSVRAALDNFLINPPPGAVLPGTEPAAARAAELAETARETFMASKRVQPVEDMIANAQTGGGRSSVTLPKAAAAFVRRSEGQSPASEVGLNPSEIASFENFADPRFRSNPLRATANALGGPVGLTALGSVPFAHAAANAYFKEDPVTGAIVGTTAPLAALALRGAANRGARRDVNALRDLVAERSPLFQQRAANASMVPPPGRGSEIMRNMLTQEILKQQMEQ
jgi:hypothetical protein